MLVDDGLSQIAAHRFRIIGFRVVECESRVVGWFRVTQNAETEC